MERIKVALITETTAVGKSNTDEMARKTGSEEMKTLHTDAMQQKFCLTLLLTSFTFCQIWSSEDSMRIVNH